MPGVFDYELSVIDSSNEPSKVKIYTASLLNIVSGTFPVLITNLIAAIDGLCNITPVGARSEAIQKLAPVGYGEGTGNREDKWLVHYHDIVSNEKKTVSLPCRLPDDGTIVMIIGSDFIDPADAAYVAFKTAFEAVAVSNTGGAVVLDAIELVGRNI